MLAVPHVLHASLRELGLRSRAASTEDAATGLCCALVPHCRARIRNECSRAAPHRCAVPRRPVGCSTTVPSHSCRICLPSQYRDGQSTSPPLPGSNTRARHWGAPCQTTCRTRGRPLQLRAPAPAPGCAARWCTSVRPSPPTSVRRLQARVHVCEASSARLRCRSRYVGLPSSRLELTLPQGQGEHA